MPERNKVAVSPDWTPEEREQVASLIRIDINNIKENSAPVEMLNSKQKEQFERFINDREKLLFALNGDPKNNFHTTAKGLEMIRYMFADFISELPVQA